MGAFPFGRGLSGFYTFYDSFDSLDNFLNFWTIGESVSSTFLLIQGLNF